MTLVKKLLYPSLNFPSDVKRIVCCDFDETYMPFDDNNKKESGIDLLEKLINENTNDLCLILGWVTGSSIDAVLRKSEGFLNFFPHFIASSLGSELYWVRGSELHECAEWNKLVEESGFDMSKMDELESDLNLHNIFFLEQSEDYQGRNMKSYFYRDTGRTQEDYNLIKKLCNNYNVRVEFTKCNPAAGDPADCYDVVFMPLCCGKDKVALFLSEFMKVGLENIYAFGDSFNDLQMLRTAGNSYLVANADPAAKKVYPNILEYKYCRGIVSKLEELLV